MGNAIESAVAAYERRIIGAVHLQDVKVLITGPHGSGKTSIVGLLKEKPTYLDTVPTMGTDEEKILYHNHLVDATLVIRDSKPAPDSEFLEKLLHEVTAVIFVVDVNKIHDKKQMAEANKMLQAIYSVRTDLKNDGALLIYLNKTDTNKRYISQAYARKVFDLDHLEKKYGLRATVQLSSAKYNEGIREGLDHFIRNLVEVRESEKFEANPNSVPDINGSRDPKQIEEQQHRLHEMKQQIANKELEDRQKSAKTE